MAGESPDTIKLDPDQVGTCPSQGTLAPRCISIIEQTAGNFFYRAPTGFDFDDRLPSQSFNASMSYVTGSHNAKVGFEMQRGHFWRGDNNDSTGGIWYTTTARRCRRSSPFRRRLSGWQNNLNYNLGIFAQDRWTMDRADAERRRPARLAERVDRGRSRRSRTGGCRTATRAYARGEERAELEGHQPARIGGLRRVRQRQDGAQGERQPRRGAGLDPLRRRQQPGEHAGHADQPRLERQQRTSAPDCDLATAVPTVTTGRRERRVRAVAHAELRQRERRDGLRPGDHGRLGRCGRTTGSSPPASSRSSRRASRCRVGYFRRVYGNFYVQDNENLAKTDFTQYSVTVPTDPRLPNSGQTVTGLYDPNMIVAPKNVIKTASDFGDADSSTGTASTCRWTRACGTASSCRVASAPARR